MFFSACTGAVAAVLALKVLPEPIQRRPFLGALVIDVGGLLLTPLPQEWKRAKEVHHFYWDKISCVSCPAPK